MRWARKIDGKLRYFGPIDPELPDFGALAALLAFHRGPLDAMQGGAGIDVGDLCNAYRASKKRMLESGELTQRRQSGSTLAVGQSGSTLVT